MASQAQGSLRGAFIVVEGLDRSGKTTQAQMLEATLAADGHRVKRLRFPDRTTPIGQMIDQYLQSKFDLDDHVIHLLFSANRWELARAIEDDLVGGTTVVCDRYYYSGIVYSAAKENPQLPLSWAREPEIGLPRPDLVVFLDLEPQEAERRRGFGGEKYERGDLQRNVRRLFLALAKTETGDTDASSPEEAEDMVVVDAGGSVEAVARRIRELVTSRLGGFWKDGVVAGKVRRVGRW